VQPKSFGIKNSIIANSIIGGQAEMQLVETEDQIAENIKTLEFARTSGKTEGYEMYRGLIKRGTCFVPYSIKSELAFAPSRFLGYIHNTSTDHAKNEKDGRETNKAISLVLKHEPDQNSKMEKHYFEFCKTVGIVPGKTASFGNPRKYWKKFDVQLGKAEQEGRDGNTDKPTSRQGQADVRVGQEQYRRDLIEWWQVCVLTGFGMEPILRASHIKPWAASNDEERLDVYNGLLLMPNLDVLFDRHYISFENNGTLLISKRLTDEQLKKLGCPKTKKVKFEERHYPYLEHHRSEFFKKEK
jgi:putative restriction endonuclease